MTTDHSTTAKMAGNFGFNTYVASDATFDRTGPDSKVHSAQEVHEVNLTSLHDEFAKITTSENLLNALRENLQKH
jgi:nicotinamidase-related amidase